MHSQLKKDVMNDYSKGNTNAYPNNIHKALTLMNKYKPLKLDTPVVPAQGAACNYYNLSSIDKKKVIKVIEQEYLAHLFLDNSNAKMQSQLKKDVANDYSKGNTKVYPNDIHTTLTLVNEYKPLKLDAQVVPAQGTVFVTGDQEGKKKGKAVTKKYLEDAEWNALSPEVWSTIIEAHKKAKNDDEDDKFSASTKSAKTIKFLSKIMKSLEKDNRRLKKSVGALQKCNEDDNDDSHISMVEGSSHFQNAMEMLEEHHPKIVLALKSSKFTSLDLRDVLLLDNQSTLIYVVTRRLHLR